LGATLTRSPAEIKLLFAALSGFSDVADLLEVSRRQLAYYTHAGQRYRSFQIPKKTGGMRDILAPANSLCIIQRKLNFVLQAVYMPSGVVHGFVNDRGIVSNAAEHSRSKYVFNIDIKDFFPSITFPRVRGMFMARPYQLPPNVATILARICCFNGALPQGAPTSPAVSNMVCARLDSQLKQLAIEYRCKYSRYADDITLSTYLLRFPRSLAYFEEKERGGNIRVGDRLRKVIQSNGFEINEKKVRLQHRSRRQEVTGLTSNQFPNVSRSFVRQVRAMLHAWQKYGLDAAGGEFFEKYDYKNRRSAAPELFRLVVKGKIDFLGMVKGKEDRPYLSALRKYADLDPAYTLPPEAIAMVTSLDTLRQAVWMVEGTAGQGTAFSLRGRGLI